jgi:hypothetical protein
MIEYFKAGQNAKNSRNMTTLKVELLLKGERESWQGEHAW